MIGVNQSIASYVELCRPHTRERVDQQMKNLRTVICSLLVVSAFGAVMTATAAAEATLLAEWLVNGAAVNELLSVEVPGTILLEDTETIAGKAAIECTGIADGSIGPNGEAEATEVLNLKGEKIGELGAAALLGTGAGSDCTSGGGCSEGTSASPIEVWPLGLPGLGELFLMATANEILGLSFSMDTADGNLGGYELLCLILGINAEDTCTGTDAEGPVVNEEPSGGVEVPANSRLTPNLDCTQSGGKATGVTETLELSFVLPLNPMTELITVSSEGFGR